MPRPAGAKLNASTPTEVHEALPVAANAVSAIPAATELTSETVSSAAAAASRGGKATPATARISAAAPASAETIVPTFETSRSVAIQCVDAQWLTECVTWWNHDGL